MADSNITLDIIYKDLELIKNKVINIEKHIIDGDIILTRDDAESIKEAEEDLIKRKTKKLI